MEVSYNITPLINFGLHMSMAMGHQWRLRQTQGAFGKDTRAGSLYKSPTQS